MTQILEAAHQIQAADMKRHTLRIIVQNFSKVIVLKMTDHHMFVVYFVIYKI